MAKILGILGFLEEFNLSKFEGLFERVKLLEYLGIVPVSNFCLVDGVLFGARALGKKKSGSIPAAARPSNTTCLILRMMRIEESSKEDKDNENNSG